MNTNLHESLIELSKEFPAEICVICHESTQSVCVIKPCKHYFCLKCIKFYLEYKITNGEVLKINCPDSDCSCQLTDSFIRKNTSDSLYSKYKAYKKLQFLEKNINLRWCIRPGCGGYSIEGPKTRKLECNVCGRNFCFYCGDEWHNESKCSNKLDKDFEEWAKTKNIKFCPNCRHRVMRNGGCSEMKCVCCQHTWCWNCGVSSKDHNDYQCLMGKNFLELYWTTIFILILSPLLMPFSIFLVLLARYEVFRQDYTHVKVWVKAWVYFCLFVVSPLLLVVCVFGYSIVFMVQVCRENVGRKNFLVYFVLGLSGGVSLALLLFVVAAVVCLVLPPFGVFFLVVKTAYAAKRRCKYQKKWQYYPRTVS
jgi:IBR domain, a half RING-finger domain